MFSRACSLISCGRSAGGRVALLCVALLAVGALAGCNNGKSGSASTTPTKLTAVDTCPAGTTSMGIPANAVIVKEQTPNHTVQMSKGQTVVIELSPNMRWSYDPAASQDNMLTEKRPSGALDSAVGTCFWQWQAQSTGTASLVFNGQPNCQASQQVCPALTPGSGNPTPGSGSTNNEPTPNSTLGANYTSHIAFTIHVK